jgi:dsDNA-specific endonuclease/ATPase MutS2
VSDEPIQIDLHGMKFLQAKTELLDSLEGYCQAGYFTFKIIHGFHGGQVLRNYVRTSLKKDFELTYPQYSLTQLISEKGSTTIIIHCNKV